MRADELVEFSSTIWKIVLLNGKNQTVPFSADKIETPFSSNFVIRVYDSNNNSEKFDNNYKLVYGCPSDGSITFTQAADFITSASADLDGSLTNAYQVKPPTASQAYCTVQSTQLVTTWGSEFTSKLQGVGT